MGCSRDRDAAGSGSGSGGSEIFGSSGRAGVQRAAGMLWTWTLLLLLASPMGAGGCVCPSASVLTRFPAEVPAGVCCLNFSGSALGHVHWSALGNETDVEVLDLSSCNISSVDGVVTSALRRLDLSHNRLRALPRGFLSGLPNLTELDLSWNLLRELPEGFLQNSDGVERLLLQGNRLQLLPSSVLQKPDVRRLDLDGNPWDCSCLLLEGLEDAQTANGSGRLQGLLGNLSCTSPPHLSGRTVWSLRAGDVCRPAGLTALFIVLPLLILSALMLCWCCGRKTKEPSAFGSSKKRSFSPGSNRQKRTDGACPGEGILKNQLLLRPASALLGSTRDIYEEVQVKPGSVESTPRVSSRCSVSTEEKQAEAGRTELDAVSVTEVMKDSADRERAYLTQSTEYYSLVPGLELEDSDHGEYENVDLS